MKEDKRIKVCITLPKKMVDDFRKIKKEIGISISSQIEFKLKGFVFSKK